MKQTALYIGFFLSLAPSLALAQALPTCSAKGYTVVFVNGVFDTKDQAEADAKELWRYLGTQYNNQALQVRTGYNPTHLAGLGDSLQSVWQQFYNSLSDFDLNTILMQIYPEVTTRKLLIVGHSQGASYANEMYDYLLAHGEPKEAVGVYAVGTPANFVAGGGAYITSTNDKVINWVAFGADTAHALKPLPGNVSLPLSAADQTSLIGGHSFVNDYLANASTQMVGDISGELSALVSTDAAEQGDCFTPPDASVGYVSQQALFAVADPTAVVVKFGLVTTYNGAVLALNTVSTLAAGAFQFMADAVTLSAAPPSEAEATQKTNKVINKLYGSSLDGLSPQDKKELLGSSQGGAVALAFSGGLVEGTSTGPGATSTASSTPAPAPFIPAPSSPTQEWMRPPVPPAPVDENTDPNTQDNATTTEEATSTLPLVTPPTPPAVAINEIEWAGDAVNPNREWIELKNLSTESVDLSGLTLVATEGGSQYIPLSGTIGPSGLLMVQRDSVATHSAEYARIIPFDQLDDAGEQLALVQVGDWGTTTVDITPPVSACGGWCAGKTAVESGFNATLSMERIDAHTAGDVASNWASNDTYSGGGGNFSYASPLSENTRHITQDYGWFCAPDTTPISAGQAYHVPESAMCTYLARFIPWQTNIMSGLYKGTVGSSTPVAVHNSWIGTSNEFREGVDSASTQPGDDYFVAIWTVRTDIYPQPLDNYTFPIYFETGHRWARDGSGPLVDTGDTNPPTENFRVIPFTYTL